MADALVWPRIPAHTAALTDGQATWARGVRCTTRSASKARARRSSTGRLGTVPPASNRATADWVMPALSASAVWLQSRCSRSWRTVRPSSRARRSDQSQRGVRHLDAVAGEFAPATRPQTRTSRSMRRSPLPHPQGATLRHPRTDRVGVPRRRNDRTSRCILLRRGPDHRTHHPPLASTDVRRSRRLAADARGGNSSRRGSSQAQLEPTKDPPGCAGPPHPPSRGCSAPATAPSGAVGCGPQSQNLQAPTEGAQPAGGPCRGGLPRPTQQPPREHHTDEHHQQRRVQGAGRGRHRGLRARPASASSLPPRPRRPQRRG